MYSTPYVTLFQRPIRFLELPLQPLACSLVSPPLRGMTHSDLWYASFIRVKRLVRACDVTNSCACTGGTFLFHTWHDSPVCEILIYVSHLCFTRDICLLHLWEVSFTCHISHWHAKLLNIKLLNIKLLNIKWLNIKLLNIKLKSKMPPSHVTWHIQIWYSRHCYALSFWISPSHVTRDMTLFRGTCLLHIWHTARPYESCKNI